MQPCSLCFTEEFCLECGCQAQKQQENEEIEADELNDVEMEEGDCFVPRNDELTDGEIEMFKELINF